MTTPDKLTIRQTLEGQTLVFNPRAAGELTADLQFVITDRENATYHLHIQDGDCTFHPCPADTPTVAIRTSSEVWLAISRGQLDGQEALMTDQYEVEGDLSLILRMNELFSGEMDYKEKTCPPGPIRLPGTVWMTLAFIPWTLFWSLFDLTDTLWLRGVLPLGLTLILIIYRLVFNKPSWLEVGSLAFFAANTAILALQIPWYAHWGSVIGSAVQGILWLASLLFAKVPLCADYARWDYSDKLVRTSLFLHPNALISLVWGWQYLLSIGLGITAGLVPSLNVLLTVLRFLLLVPAFIFTERHPKNADNHPIRDVKRSFRRIRVLAGIGMVIAVGLIGLMIWLG